MSAATLSDAEVESLVLRSADDLFYTHGVSNVTMAQVRDASGVSMRRLYGFAPSKSVLVGRWLQHRHVTWTNGFVERVDLHMAAGADPVDAIFDALTDWMTDTDFRGCGFINTHAESAELSQQNLAIIRAHKAELAMYLHELTGWGPSMAVLVDGAIVHASIFSSAEPIRSARLAANTLTPTRKDL